MAQGVRFKALEETCEHKQALRVVQKQIEGLQVGWVQYITLAWLYMTEQSGAVDSRARFHRAQKAAKHNKTILTRIRIPAKITCLMVHLTQGPNFTELLKRKKQLSTTHAFRVSSQNSMSHVQSDWYQA